MKFRAEIETNGKTATGIEGAKRAETRTRRTHAAMDRLRHGRAQR